MLIQNKNLLLVSAIVLIVGAIWYLQAGKVHPTGSVVGEVLTDIPTASATSTMPDAVSGDTGGVTATSVKVDTMAVERKAKKAKEYDPARELVLGGGFINTDSFKLKDLIGKKVILLDFWTYSCINCQRTIPYLNAWYEKYKDQGLVIVGVHTPEFDFEKVYENVANAAKEAGIMYPIVQDNEYATWQTYGNRYWPREYLIDIDGFIAHDHIGEGGYDETERAIQSALKERAQVLGLKDTVSTDIVNPTDVITMDPGKVRSPETYFGAARNEYLGNGAQGKVGAQDLAMPSSIQSNTLYLGGNWNFTNEYTENTAVGAKITYKYNAKNVYFVASADDFVDITVMLDGKDIGHQTIKDNKLYTLVKGTAYGEHTLEIIVNNPGLMAYTFTFG